MSIKEELFKGTEVIVDAKLKRYKRDVTIPSVIMGVENNGKYKITLDGRNYTVKCSLPNVDLRVGQGVWIKIPNGDFGSKHICGLR